MSKKTYDYYTDPAHGWVVVETRELVTLGIYQDISEFSYLSKTGTLTFLEEDSDYRLFLDAKNAVGDEVELKHHYSERSRIRSYPPYDAEWVDEWARML